MKDSISSARNNYDPYTTQNYPRNPRSSHLQGSSSGISGGADSLQISQERLEQQVAARFRANNFQVPNQRLAIVARAGKYVFYAVALPPYIILYGIPKWLLFVAMPEIMLMIQQQLMRGCRALKERFMLMAQPYIDVCKDFLALMKKTLGLESKNNFLMAYIKAPWQALQTLYGKSLKAMQNSLATIKHKIGEFSASIQEKINAFYGPTVAIVKKMAVAPFKAMKRGLQNGLNRAKSTLKALKNVPMQAYQKMKTIGEELAEAALRPFKQLAKALKTIPKLFGSVKDAVKERMAFSLLPWIAPFAPNLFNKLLNKWVKNNPVLSKAVGDRASRLGKALAPLFSAANLIKKGLWHLSRPQVAVKKLLGKIQSRGESAKEFLTEQIVLPIKESLHKQFSRAKRALERVQKFGSKCLAKAQEIPQQLAMLLPLPLINLFGIQLNPNLTPWALVRKQKKLREKIAKKLGFVGRGMRKGKTWAVGTINKLQDRAYAFCKSLWKLKDRFKGIKKKVDTALVEVTMAYRRRKHWVRLMMAWLKVLTRHWLQKMREYVSDLGRETRRKMYLEKLDRRT